MRLVALLGVAASSILFAACGDARSFGGEVVVFGIQQGPPSGETREISGSFEIQRFQGRGPSRLHVRNKDARECYSTTYGATPRFTEPGDASFIGSLFPGGALHLGPDPDEPVRVTSPGWRGGERVGFRTSGFGLPSARGTVTLPEATVRVIEPEGSGPLALARSRGLPVTWGPTRDMIRVTVRVPSGDGTTTSVTCFFDGEEGRGRLEPELLAKLPVITHDDARLVVTSHTQSVGTPAGWWMYVVAESVLVERPIAAEVPNPASGGGGAPRADGGSADAGVDASDDAPADADPDAAADAG